jgi:NAD(P)-dependent dehydrogenase (short-subunit alcohol dehydrogenase family)
MKRAAGKTVVLTGCTKGLGRAMSRFFASEGAVVLGCGRDERDLAALRGEFPGAHRFDRVDVAVEDEVKAWAGRVLSEQGAPDLLLNNAAIINANARLWEVSAEDAERVIRVNVLGVIQVLRAFVPAMIQRGSGVVVNFSSGWGRSTSPEVGTYCASKWAVEGLTRSLAQDLAEVGSAVAAVALNPGVIDTQMLRSCFGGAAGDYPAAEDWVKRAGPFLLSLGMRQSGRSLDVPGIPTA